MPNVTSSDQTGRPKQFEIRMKRSAIEELKALPIRDQKFILKKLDMLRSPKTLSELAHELDLPTSHRDKVFRMTIGSKYRILFDLNQEERLIVILAVLAHHHAAFKLRE